MSQIEIVYSNSMKINRGNYEQEAPFYSAKTVITLPEGHSLSDLQDAYKVNYEQLKAIVEPLLLADYNAKRTDLANIRFREKDGKRYPSVTSILNPDGMSSKIKNLEKYSERGNQADEIFKALMTKMEDVVPIPEKFAPLDWPWDIKQFIRENKLFKKSEMELWKRDVEVFNDEWLYSGEIDLLKDGKLCLDVKSGAWKWEQQIMYAKCFPSITHVAIADLKEGKYIELPISDPIIQKAWEKALVKRGEFRARFGI